MKAPHPSIALKLPDLSKIVHQVKFPEGDTQSETIRNALRQIADRVREREPITFYGQQEVADIFGVSLRTASLAFRLLADEGVLQMKQGTRTLLYGTRAQPAHPVLGVIGVGVSKPDFVCSPRLRHFYHVLEQELRTQNYVMNYLFFDREEATERIMEEVVRHKLDVFFWLAPNGQRLAALEALLHDGIPVITANRLGRDIPGQRFRLSREKALKEAMRTWKEKGIEHLYLLDTQRLGPHFPVDDFRSLQQQLSAFPFKQSVISLSSEKTEEQLQTLPSYKNTGMVSLGIPLLDLKLLQTMLARFKFLSIQEPCCLPAAHGAALITEALLFDFKFLAKTISRTLCERDQWWDANPKMRRLEARYEPACPVPCLLDDLPYR